MIPFYSLIDTFKQMLRKRGVKSNRLPEVRCHVKLNYTPYTAGIIRIIKVIIYFMHLWKWIAIRDQSFIMQGQRFFHVFECLRHSATCGEATRHVRDNHSIV